jgi:hypothetical protein
MPYFNIPTVPADSKEIKRADLLRHIIEIKEWINKKELGQGIGSALIARTLGAPELHEPVNPPPSRTTTPKCTTSVIPGYVKLRDGTDVAIAKLTQEQREMVLADSPGLLENN